MIDLERSLGELAERLEIPGDDWLLSDVLRRIGEPQHRAVSRRLPRLAGALAAIVVVAMIALPGPRRAVARWLGFDSVRIEPGVTVPTTAAPTTIPVITVADSPSTTQPAIDIGPAVSIDEAIEQTGLPDPSPALLGEARSIHVMDPPRTGQIMVVYAPSELIPQSAITGVGALVSVMPANLAEGLFGKTLGDDSTVRSVDVDGAQGYWIEGSPHQVFFEVGDDIQQDTLRLATNTLLWQRDGHVYRIEADIDLATALRIAASVP